MLLLKLSILNHIFHNMNSEKRFDFILRHFSKETHEENTLSWIFTVFNKILIEK